ncbi:restriction endonuclease [Methylocystis hirsuta]|uniref:Restriction endonuclease n=2 Tax=Methylocystis hirsuta TaxID=369798 RepID=A0A3M9XTR5_9HYPH|nr:restriction endonuclease [Methylocystis hirsuta]
MVRAGRNGYLFDRFKELSIVALGWAGVGSEGDLSDKAALCSKLKDFYPEATEQSIFVAASQLVRFAHELQVGDRVVTYDPRARIYQCGIIKGPCEYHPNADEPTELTNRRMVEWGREKARDDLSLPARNSLGATLTLFFISSSISSELWSERSLTPSNDFVTEKDSEATFDPSAIELSELADEKIKDRIVRLDEYSMQELVAGLLRAMGYKTIVSARGPDRGKDIVASPDGFGFQAPRIVVEVKHRPRERMGPQEIRSFLGGRKPHESGLYVSTGGFTREAYYEAERSNVPLTLLDFEELVRAVLSAYASFDESARKLIPLTPIYWPL